MMKTARILLSCAVVSTLTSASIVESFSLKGGIDNAKIATEGDAGVIDYPADKNGHAINAELLFNLTDEGFFSTHMPYIDWHKKFHSDREISIFGIGLKRTLPIDEALKIYGSAGVGYGTLEWKRDPIDYVISRDVSAESYVGTLQAGVDYAVSDNIDLGVGVRLDGYEFSTDFRTFLSSAQSKDYLAVSVLAGLTFHFGGVSDAPSPAVAAAEVKKPAAVEEENTEIVQQMPEEIAREVVKKPDAPVYTYVKMINFAFDSYALSPHSKQELESLVHYLKAKQSVRLNIIGHTCSMGPERYNMKLSNKRAGAVQAYLIQEGIASERITTEGRGESQPLVANTTKANREMNRRTEFEIITE